MDPLSILYSWEAILLAIAISAVTQTLKGLLVNVREARWVKLGALPAVPIAVGVALAIFVPLRPDSLVQYAAERGDSWSIFAIWGAAVGQFSAYLYDRAKKTLRGFRDGNVS